MINPPYGWVLFFGDSDYGPNEYGDNPKGQGNDKYYYGSHTDPHFTTVPATTNPYPVGKDNNNGLSRNF